MTNRESLYPTVPTGTITQPPNSIKWPYPRCNVSISKELDLERFCGIGCYDCRHTLVISIVVEPSAPAGTPTKYPECSHYCGKEVTNVTSRDFTKRFMWLAALLIMNVPLFEAGALGIVSISIFQTTLFLSWRFSVHIFLLFLISSYSQIVSLTHPNHSKLQLERSIGCCPSI